MFKQAPEQQNIKEQILTAAEELFAGVGYKSASLRAITAEAGVNLAAVNYYFGSKEGLLEAVFERRLRPLNELRQRMLKEIQERSAEKGQSPPIKDVLAAFIEPVLKMKNSGLQAGVPGGALFGRSYMDSDETVQKIFRRIMRPTFQLTLDLLSESLPGIPKEMIFWRLQFVIGSMARIMRIYKNPENKYMYPVPEPDMEELMRSLLSFATAGMEELKKSQNGRS